MAKIDGFYYPYFLRVICFREKPTKALLFCLLKVDRYIFLFHWFHSWNKAAYYYFSSLMKQVFVISSKYIYFLIIYRSLHRRAQLAHPIIVQAEKETIPRVKPTIPMRKEKKMAIQNQRIPILVSLLWHSRTVTPAACLFRKSISLCGKYIIIIFYVKKNSWNHIFPFFGVELFS